MMMTNQALLITNGKIFRETETQFNSKKMRGNRELCPTVLM